MVRQSKSEELYQRALQVMPGGCSRNTVLRKPHPLYASHARGCYITDIDNVKRVDFANNMASLIHGHSHPNIISAVTDQLQKGTAFTLATEEELLYAEYMCSRNENFEKIRFVNSGTEAVMACLKAARAYTGKSKIAKVEGAYHGLYDYAEISQNSNPENWGDIDSPASTAVTHGTPASALNDVIVIPFNDPDRAIAILNQHSDELACVLIDPMPHRAGLIPATKKFYNALRQWTTNQKVLLILDEVITFRSEYSGAQQWFNTPPDLTALGKMIGGGFPVGAIAGRKEVMEVMNPLVDKVLFPHSGTFSANPITMTAGRVAMELYDHSAVERLNKLGGYARRQINEAIRIADIEACVTGYGSLFRIHLQTSAPQNYRAAYNNTLTQKHIRFLLNYLFDNGIILVNTCTGILSTVMTNKEIDTLVEALLNGFRKIKNVV